MHVFKHGRESAEDPARRHMLPQSSTTSHFDGNDQQRKSRLTALTIFSRLSGWRRGAVVNTVMITIVGLILLITAVVLWTKSGTLHGVSTLYSGDCATGAVGRLNTALHLVINLCSTLVLASTNFFMQVLNAPDRQELDRAHKKGSWLDIGTSSTRNTFKISPLKSTLWVLFLISSIPIHVLFNSVIFATDFRQSGFAFSVFDESLLAGEPVYVPGASLSMQYTYEVSENWWYNGYDFQNVSWDASSPGLYGLRDFYMEFLYSNTTGPARAAAQILDGTWQRLDTATCRSMYSSGSCTGLQNYGDVALILENASPWTRSQVWDLGLNDSSFWDPYVPSEANNSLWYAPVMSEANVSPCSVALKQQYYNNGRGASHMACFSECADDLGLNTASETWTYDLFLPKDQYTMVAPQPSPSYMNKSLEVKSCYAEPLKLTCEIGVSKTLLLGVLSW